MFVSNSIKIPVALLNRFTSLTLNRRIIYNNIVKAIKAAVNRKIRYIYYRSIINILKIHGFYYRSYVTKSVLARVGFLNIKINILKLILAFVKLPKSIRQVKEFAGKKKMVKNVITNLYFATTKKENSMIF